LEEAQPVAISDDNSSTATNDLNRLIPISLGQNSRRSPRRAQVRDFLRTR
jgi:hypothetical protein